MNFNFNKRNIPILVSVRSQQEAIMALNGGADLVDAKEPKHGALGALPISEINKITKVLRGRNYSGPITATFGDSIDEPINFNSKLFISYFCQDIDAVKIGFDARGTIGTRKLFDHLCFVYENKIIFFNSNESNYKMTKIVPVLIVDHGLDLNFIDFILQSNVSKYFLGIMLDTKTKVKTNIFNVLSVSDIKKASIICASNFIPFGIAGSLNLFDSENIIKISPSWAGYRGGVCHEGRDGDISIKKIKAVKNALEFSK